MMALVVATGIRLTLHTLICLTLCVKSTLKSLKRYCRLILIESFAEMAFISGN